MIYFLIKRDECFTCLPFANGVDHTIKDRMRARARELNTMNFHLCIFQDSTQYPLSFPY